MTTLLSHPRTSERQYCGTWDVQARNEVFRLDPIALAHQLHRGEILVADPVARTGLAAIIAAALDFPANLPHPQHVLTLLAACFDSGRAGCDAVGGWIVVPVTDAP